MNNRKHRQWVAVVALLWAVACTLARFDLFAAPGPALSASAIPLSLKYEEVPYTMLNVRLAVTPLQTSFAREPGTGQTNLHRGRLNIGTNATGFLLDCLHGRLWLDLNGNDDLTDDPAGVFTSTNHASMGYAYATFEGIRLQNLPISGSAPCLLDLHFTIWRKECEVSAGVHSLFSAKVLLHEREWQAGIIEAPAADDAQLWLLLRPWERHLEKFAVRGVSSEAFAFSSNVFAGTQLYDVQVAGSGAAERRLVFTPRAVALGDLEITGQLIERLLLQGPTTVILEAPSGTARVPVGTYSNYLVRLRKGDFSAYRDPWKTKSVTITPDSPLVLHVGGPLTNSVTVERHRGELLLQHRLLGAGGDTYNPAVRNTQNPPRFAIYQGGRQIAAGDFEYG